jgi:hypothetical protein
MACQAHRTAPASGSHPLTRTLPRPRKVEPVPDRAHAPAIVTATAVRITPRLVSASAPRGCRIRLTRIRVVVRRSWRGRRTLFGGTDPISGAVSWARRARDPSEEGPAPPAGAGPASHGSRIGALPGGRRGLADHPVPGTGPVDRRTRHHQHAPARSHRRGGWTAEVDNSQQAISQEFTMSSIAIIDLAADPVGQPGPLLPYA